MISLKESLMLAAGAFVVAVCSVLLYLDMNAISARKGSIVEGVITYRYRTAQRRHSGSALWENVDQRSPVYRNNFIRTDERSEAVINLNNGTGIELEPNTMIVLEVEDGVPQIKLKRGSLVLRRRDGSGNVRIKSSDSVVDLRKGELRINRQMDGSLDVTTMRGSAEFRTGNKKRTIRAGEQAFSRAKIIKVRKLPVGILEPEDNLRLFVDTIKAAVRFRFAGSGSYRLQIARQYNFSTIFLNLKKFQSGDSVLLPEGLFYWRVARDGSPTNSDSYAGMRRLRILRNRRMHQIAPAADDRFKYVERTPLIRFSWHKIDIAESYFLVIARDAKFQSILHKIPSQREAISVPLQAETYYWRVSYKGLYPGSAGKSSVRRLVVIQGGSLRSPLMGRPRSGEIIAQTTIKNKGTLFLWSGDREYKRYKLLISHDEDFKKPIVNATLQENFLNLRRQLAAGSYYWKVQGVTAGGIPGPISSIANFRVQSQKKKVTPENIRAQKISPKKLPSARESKPGDPFPLSPRNGSTVDMTKADFIQFRWRSVRGVRFYKFSLYRKRRKIYEKMLRRNSFRFRNLNKLDTGRFSWKIKATTTWNGKPYIASGSGKFVITLQEQPNKPQLKMK